MSAYKEFTATLNERAESRKVTSKDNYRIIINTANRKDYIDLKEGDYIPRPLDHYTITNVRILSDDEIYQYKLKNHDWYYAYSDCRNVYNAGKASWSHLVELQKRLDPNYELWNELAPEDFKKK